MDDEQSDAFAELAVKANAAMREESLHDQLRQSRSEATRLAHLLQKQTALTDAYRLVIKDLSEDL